VHVKIIVREYVFYVFENPKKRLFAFFEVAFQKYVEKRNPKFKVSDFAEKC